MKRPLPPPPTRKTIYVDNSLLKTVARCSTEAFLRHSQGLTVEEDAVAAYCGQVWHEVLCDYLAGQSPENCRIIYEMMYREYSNAHVPDDPKHRFYRLRWENTDKIMQEWFTQHPRHALPFSVNPKLLEIGFQVPLSDECVCGHAGSNHKTGLGCQWRRRCGCTEFKHAFIFYGRLDGLVTAQHDNSAYVLDHKTTGRLTPWKAEEYRYDSQMSGYVWAAQQTLGQAVAGIYINAIELSVLPSDPVRICKNNKFNHGVPYAECGPLHMNSQFLIYTRSAEQLEEWRKSALHLAKRYRDLREKYPTLDMLHKVRTQGTFHGACGFCNFKDFCGAGRPLQYVDSMLIKSPWRPFGQDVGEKESET